MASSQTSLPLSEPLGSPGPDRGVPPGHAVRWMTWAVLLCGLLAPIQVLANGWVLDDLPVVRDNPALARGVGGLPRLLRRPSWPGDLEEQPYRPLALVTLALERTLTGKGTSLPSPRSAHVVNLLLHAAAGVLLLRLLLRLAPGRPVLALGTALCFALHPLAVGVVTLASARSALLGVVLGLAALLAWLRWRRGAVAELPLVAVGVFLALFACEALIALPLGLVVAEALLPRSGATRGTRWRDLAATLGAVLAVYLLLWPGPGGAGEAWPEPGLGGRLLLGLEALGRDVLKVLVPVGLLPDRSAEASAAGAARLAGPALLAAVLAATALLCALLARLRRAPGRTLGLLLLVAGAGVIGSALTLPAGAVLEDRWAYVALPALAVLGGLGAEALARFAQGSTARGLAVRAAASAALLSITLLSARQAAAFRSDESVHERLLARPAGHGPALLRMAAHLTRGAEADIRAAHGLISDDPRHVQRVSEAHDKRSRAYELLLRAVRQGATRDDPEAWLALGQLHLEQGAIGPALEALTRALQAQAGHAAPSGHAGLDVRRLRRAARIHVGLARVHAAQGHTGMAGDAAQQAALLEQQAARLSGQPADGLLLHRSATALLGAQRFGRAAELLEQVALTAEDAALRAQARAQVEPARQAVADLRATLLAEGRGHEETSHWKPAVETYEEVLRVDPACHEARYRAAWLRGTYFGSYELALDYVAEGLALLEASATTAETASWRTRFEELKGQLERRRAAEDD